MIVTSRHITNWTANQCDVVLDTTRSVKLTLTEQEVKFRDFMKKVDKTYIANSNKAYNLTCIGRSDLADDQYDRVADLNYLHFILIMIDADRAREKRDDDCGEASSTTFYVELYNLRCIRDYFQCKGISIDALLLAYDMAIGVDFITGINFMQIEGPDATPCDVDTAPFKVK